jgi:hypothetical protein
MDPNVTLKDALDAYCTDEDSLAREHADNLFDWLQREGFAPDLSKLNSTQQRLLIALAMAHIVND